MSEEEKREAYERLGILKFMDARKSAEDQRKAADPLNIKRYEASDSMQESETGEMVKYEDFLKAVEYLKKQAKVAYSDGYDSGKSYHISTSWRD